MKRFRYPAYVFLLVLLSACASYNLLPRSFNSTAQEGFNIVQGFGTTIITLLAADKIKPDDAQNAKDQAQNLKDGLDIAVSMQASGTPGAQDKLDATIIALRALEAYLAKQQKAQP